MTYKVLIADKLGQDGLERLDQMEDISYDMRTGLLKEERLAIIGDYDAGIVRSDTRIDADVIAAGKQLKVVGRGQARVGPESSVWGCQRTKKPPAVEVATTGGVENVTTLRLSRLIEPGPAQC